MTDELDPSLTEISALIEALPPWRDDHAPARAAGMPPPYGTLGLLDDLAAWAGAGQGRCPPRLERPRAATFLGRWEHGADAEATAALDALRMGRARVSALCRAYDAELRVYEMALDETAGGAAPGGLTQKQCAAAMAYGMTAVEEGLDLICLAASGPGVALAAAALSHALFADTGPGDGAPLAALARHGGHALAALAGTVIAARVARVPVILDGFGALAAAAALHRLNGSALDHCVLAQQALGGAFLDLQKRLGKASVIDLGIAAEDGSAALLVLGLLRGALARPENGAI
jgi:nicotinate-nucleotide--dimethylbenzimidazole phosphoribosyltransferase